MFAWGETKGIDNVCRKGKDKVWEKGNTKVWESMDDLVDVKGNTKLGEDKVGERR